MPTPITLTLCVVLLGVYIGRSHATFVIEDETWAQGTEYEASNRLIHEWTTPNPFNFLICFSRSNSRF